MSANLFSKTPSDPLTASLPHRRWILTGIVETRTFTELGPQFIKTASKFAFSLV